MIETKKAAAQAAAFFVPGLAVSPPRIAPFSALVHGGGNLDRIRSATAYSDYS